MESEKKGALIIVGIVGILLFIALSLIRLLNERREADDASHLPIVEVDYRDILKRRSANEVEVRAYFAGVRTRLTAYVKEIREVPSYEDHSRNTPAYVVLDDMSANEFSAYILSSYLPVVKSLRRDVVVSVICNEVMWENPVSLSKCSVKKIETLE